MKHYPDITEIKLLEKKVKNMDYLKIKNVNLVSLVPFICFLKAIN